MKTEKTVKTAAPLKTSKATIDRLPLYFRTLRLAQDEGIDIIPSEELGRRLGITPEQIRKDLASFGQFGKNLENLSAVFAFAPIHVHPHGLRHHIVYATILQRTELATEEFHDRNSLRRSAIEKGVLHVLVKDHGATHVALIDKLIIPLGHLLRSFLLPISFSIRRFPGGSLRRTTFRADPDSPE